MYPFVNVRLVVVVFLFRFVMRSLNGAETMERYRSISLFVSLVVISCY